MLLSALVQARGLGPCAARLQSWAGAAALQAAQQRWLSSTPSDDFNREMAEFFGLPPAPQQQQGAAPSAAAVGAAAGSSPGAHLAPDVQELNAELFSVMGAQPQGDGNAAAAASLAQQLAAGTGAPGQTAAAQAATLSRAGSSPARAFAASSLAAAAAAAAAAAPDSGAAGLTHVDGSGRATMVDVSHKRDTVRTAVAAARVVLGPEVFELVARNQVQKGDVLTVAQLAGVMGAKHTAMLIPLCHSIALSSVHVALALAPEAAAVDVRAEATTVGPTGVEMEALTAAAVAALCVYDMCKAASKAIAIQDLRLLAKSGGKSGEWAAPA